MFNVLPCHRFGGLLFILHYGFTHAPWEQFLLVWCAASSSELLMSMGVYDCVLCIS